MLGQDPAVDDPAEAGVLRLGREIGVDLIPLAAKAKV